MSSFDCLFLLLLIFVLFFPLFRERQIQRYRVYPSAVCFSSQRKGGVRRQHQPGRFHLLASSSSFFSYLTFTHLLAATETADYCCCYCYDVGTHQAKIRVSWNQESPGLNLTETPKSNPPSSPLLFFVFFLFQRESGSTVYTLTKPSRPPFSLPSPSDRCRCRRRRQEMIIHTLRTDIYIWGDCSSCHRDDGGLSLSLSFSLLFFYYLPKVSNYSWNYGRAESVPRHRTIPFASFIHKPQSLTIP